MPRLSQLSQLQGKFLSKPQAPFRHYCFSPCWEALTRGAGSEGAEPGICLPPSRSTAPGVRRFREVGQGSWRQGSPEDHARLWPPLLRALKGRTKMMGPPVLTQMMEPGKWNLQGRHACISPCHSFCMHRIYAHDLLIPSTIDKVVLHNFMWAAFTFLNCTFLKRSHFCSFQLQLQHFQGALPSRL